MSLGLLEKVGGGGGTHRALGGVHWRQWPGQVKGCRGDDTGGPRCCAEKLFGWDGSCEARAPTGRVLQELTCLSRNRQTLLPGCGQHSGQLVALMCVGAGNLVAGNDTLGARRKCQFD